MNKIFYNNEWHKSLSKIKYSKNSFLNSKINYYPNCSEQDLQNVTNSAIKGLKEFESFSLKKRSIVLKSIAKEIRKKYKIIAKLEAEDTGKKIANAQKEILYAVKIWDYASHQLKVLKPIKQSFNKKKLGEILYEPVGCVALIVPWNYPFIVASERLPFIIGSGNSVIIKPSEYASSSLSYLVQILKKQKLPPGLINLIYGKGENIGAKLVKSKKVNMISFTGSTKTGKKIMKSASKGIKRLSLELGGKNSIIILEDANIKKAVKICIESFCSNSGQACVATTKLILNNKIKIKFIEKLKLELKKIKNFKKILGPITTKFQFEKIHKIIDENKKYNKNIIFGDIKKRKDQYIFPIVYEGLPLKNSINKKEIFGPVLSIITFKKGEQAIKIANDTNYGLSAIVCSKNINKAKKISKKLNSGRIWINNSTSVNFPHLPIGGYKESGLNRECGNEGFKTYSEIKSIII